MRKYKGKEGDMKGFLYVKGCSLGKNGKLYSTPHTHTVCNRAPAEFLGVDCDRFPGEISEAARCGVSISGSGAHLEVFRGDPYSQWESQRSAMRRTI